MSRLILLAALAAGPACAQDAPAPDPAAAPDASAIVVTGVRAPTPLDRVSTAVTVLDRPTLDLAQPLVVSDVLVRTPGLSVARNGGYGGTTSVFIRGADSDGTVVVIDGVKLNDPSSPAGGYDFSDLVPGDAARVEVLRGPQSTLWGSQAIGGVVNVVTDLPSKALQGSAEAEGGSRGTASGRAAVGGKSGDITWEVAGNGLRTDGISAVAPAFGGHERDGYSHEGGSARVTAALTPDLGLDFRGYVSHGRADIDETFGTPDTPEYVVTTNWIGYGGANLALLDGRFRNRIAFTRADTDRDSYDPRVTGDDRTFIGRGRTSRIEYEGSFAVTPDWTAIFGAEHEHARFDAISPQYQATPDRGASDENSGYAQLTGTLFRQLTLTGGVRRDDQSNYGGKTLFSAGGVWAVPDGTTFVRANYGEGFKAPSLYQLYSEYGNRALRPEQAHGWDASVEQHLLGDHLTVSAGYFERATRDLISFAFAPFRPDRPFGYYQNVARAETHGIEAGASARYGALTLDGNYSWVDARDRSPGSTYGNELARRPHQLANASAGYRWSFGLVTTAAVRVASHSFDDAANATRLAGYTLVDLRAEQPIGHGLTLFGRIENLADKHYETAYEYNQLGRSVYGGVRARF